MFNGATLWGPGLQRAGWPCSRRCCQRRKLAELCRILSITFKAPDIAVAVEDMDALREEITKMGDGAIFEPGS